MRCYFLVVRDTFTKTDWAPVKSIITNSNSTVFDELNWYLLLSFFKFTLEWKLIQSLLRILILMIWNSYSLLESIWKHQIMIDSLLVCWWYWTESIAGLPATIWFNPWSTVDSLFYARRYLILRFNCFH